MADQGRWFKVWCSSLLDPHLSNLSLEDFARWVKLGTLIKEQGTDGVLTLQPPADFLCAMLKICNFESLISIIKTFPNLTVTPVTNSSVTYSIKYENWHKYQGDFSGDRVKKWRAKKRQSVTPKKRREEKRRDEMRKELNTDAASGGNPPSPPAPKNAEPMTTEEYFTFCREEVPRWLENRRSLWKKAYPGIDLDQESAKALSWLISNSEKRKKRLDRFLNAWMDRAQESPRARGHPGGNSSGLEEALRRTATWSPPEDRKGEKSSL